ncbi:lmo0954 family membrane protein [Oceanobacillus kapialis]|uniref:Flagellar basal body rod protein n=1 Tax=Oceanobacillus kapialis TaxID=481353 RepID=A0ABW5Q0M2_9BACI
MKKFMLFTGGLIALLVLLANIGPMILLGISVWLLYVIFKQFVKSDSTAGKIGWVVLGLLVLSVTFSNVFAVIGLLATYVLYIIYRSWKQEKNESVVEVMEDDDPFKNFERQWAEINQY